MNKINDIFKDKNLKLTPQRYAIYKFLKSVKTHPSAEMIYNELKQDYPTMSLATVYKTLKTLIELNLVQELNVGEDNFRYDANVDIHPHIICLNCGKVDDIENTNFDNLKKDVLSYTDYDVLSYKLYFYGICSECKKGR
ncbi:Fur family transcriptional regulator, peroxide stress response regulator [Caloramator quimbayensis]|uniref:Fur family transcriptional regulator, peroxide stress response regulator n=1 Tax=Caloramator quimbayensis TaxID=1147123 RepID=A0A1T4X462_9CLOT|nr:transcriptional repressor [Caloramator quimbayensis]SKA83641.1 Fur family transcriptional regulator, peroxide stress response regulator [Caloramator quimbayensis]